jgi:hypothetical protein
MCSNCFLHRRCSHFTVALCAILGVLLSACGNGSPEMTATDTLLARGTARGSAPSGLARELADLRSATARFHSFEQAESARYDFLFMDMCMFDASPDDLGAMGYHYVNTGLLDGSLSISEPEALLYERGPGGQLRLVGVEYVIPKDAWTAPEPPQLFGQNLVLNGFDLWALHVWVWRDNPAGIFADWNPDVSCD